MLPLYASAALAGAPLPTLALAESWPSGTTLDHAELPDAADVWPKLLAAAKTSIDLGEFYVSTSPDSKLEPVLAELRAADARGVTVRMVVDSKLAKTYPDTLAELDALPHVEVRKLPMETLTGGVMHAKYFIVDGKTAWMGSQNFDWRSLQHVQELGVSTTAPGAVATWSSIFAVDWAIAGGSTLEAALAAAPKPHPVEETVDFGGASVQATAYASPTGWLGDESAWDLPVLLAAVKAAKTTIRLQALSYERIGYDKVEWHDLDDALRDAAARGVKVELLVADWSKAGDKLASVQALAKVSGITVKFVDIPQPPDQFIDFARVVHAKYVTIDGAWSWIGTSNFGRDYFYESRDLALVVRGSPFASELERFFDSVWGSAYTEVVDPTRTDYHAPPKKK